MVCKANGEGFDCEEPDDSSSLIIFALGLLLLASLAGLIILAQIYRRARGAKLALVADLAATLPSASTKERDLVAGVAELKNRLEEMAEINAAAELERERYLRKIGDDARLVAELRKEAGALRARAVAPPPGFDGRALAGMAAQAFVAVVREAETLAEADPEFAVYYRALKLEKGANDAAEIGRSSSRCETFFSFQDAMDKALQTGQFDAVLTSLDVLAAYASPSRDWRAFLICLEAGEGLLSLALLDCDIRLKKMPLMTPLDKAAIVDFKGDDDSRGLRNIRSAVEKANDELSRLGGAGQGLLFDLYSPGWSSPRSHRVAHGAWYDRTSMSGEPQ